MARAQKKGEKLETDSSTDPPIDLKLPSIVSDPSTRPTNTKDTKIKEQFAPVSFLSNQPIYQCYLISLRSRNLINQQLKKEGFRIPAEHAWIMGYLFEYPGITQNEIAKYTHRDNPTMTRILDQLEKIGYVERRRHESDRRSFRVYVTKEGKKALTKIFGVLETCGEKFFYNQLSPKQYHHLLGLLNKVWLQVDQVENE